MIEIHDRRAKTYGKRENIQYENKVEQQRMDNMEV